MRECDRGFVKVEAGGRSIASSRTFNDNGESNFAGVLSNPFDDARVYANGAVTLNGMPTFSSFGDGLTLGPTGRLQILYRIVAF